MALNSGNSVGLAYTVAARVPEMSLDVGELPVVAHNPKYHIRAFRPP